ncbi:MAG TPA: hypothetical protein VIX19_03685 [Terriglobales bacterium]
MSIAVRARGNASAEINVTPLIDVLLVLPDHLHGGTPAASSRRVRGDSPAEPSTQAN